MLLLTYVIPDARAQNSPRIVGKIQWDKQYGLPSSDGGRTPDKCTAFRVRATVEEGGGPNEFGTPVNVGFIVWRNREPKKEGNSYVCRYAITDQNNDLPRNPPIRVWASFDITRRTLNPTLNQSLATGRWYGGDGIPSPEPGFRRVGGGGRSVTLTNSAPRAIVDFHVADRRIPEIN
jgi:hypothetical protein